MMKITGTVWTCGGGTCGLWPGRSSLRAFGASGVLTVEAEWQSPNRPLSVQPIVAEAAGLDLAEMGSGAVRPAPRRLVRAVENQGSLRAALSASMFTAA